MARVKYYKDVYSHVARKLVKWSEASVHGIVPAAIGRPDRCVQGHGKRQVFDHDTKGNRSNETPVLRAEERDICPGRVAECPEGNPRSRRANDNRILLQVNG